MYKDYIVDHNKHRLMQLANLQHGCLRNAVYGRLGKQNRSGSGQTDFTRPGLSKPEPNPNRIRVNLNLARIKFGSGGLTQTKSKIYLKFF